MLLKHISLPAKLVSAFLAGNFLRNEQGYTNLKPDRKKSKKRSNEKKVKGSAL